MMLVLWTVVMENMTIFLTRNIVVAEEYSKLPTTIIHRNNFATMTFGSQIPMLVHR